MTQETLAEKLGISKELVRRYESLIGFPNKKTWKKMKQNAEIHHIELSEEIFTEWADAKYNQIRSTYG
jgi:ribosome-binding protein aMBF1 (putative translation factor)